MKSLLNARACCYGEIEKKKKFKIKRYDRSFDNSKGNPEAKKKITLRISVLQPIWIAYVNDEFEYLSFAFNNNNCLEFDRIAFCVNTYRWNQGRIYLFYGGMGQGLNPPRDQFCKITLRVNNV